MIAEIPQKLIQVLKHEGVIAIVSQGANAPHVVNTWNSYIRFTDEGHWLVPVGGMRVTQQNLSQNPNLLITVGSREVMGFHSMGTGFLIRATGAVETEGADYEQTKLTFPWCRAILRISPLNFLQTL